MLPVINDITIQKIPSEQLHTLEALNYEIFGERRIINHSHHDFQVILTAKVQHIPVGFKIGYGRNKGEFYSAKGGVLPQYRRMKLADRMFEEMIRIATLHRYTTFTYDTFPNMNPGMLILGLNKGFKVSFAGYNPRYNDYQVTLTKNLSDL